MTADHPSGRASCRIAALAAALLLTVFHPAPLAAQDSVPALKPGDTLHLTLGDLLDSIQTSHPAVKQGSAATLAAHARRNALGRILENPEFELQHTSKNSYLPYLRQPIIWPWTIIARRHLGDADVAVAHAESESRTDSVALDAAQRFADALRTQAEYALTSEAESLAHAVLDRAVLARQLGQAGDLTVLQARVSLDAARRDRVTAGEARRTAAAGLALLIGLPPETPVVPEGDLTTLAPVAEPDSGYAAQALGSDPEMKRYSALMLRSQREASMWRAEGRIPDLAIGPSYGWTINSHPNIQYLGFDLTLSIPLWHGRDAEIDAANQERAAAEAGRAARQQQLDFLVLDASRTVARATRQLASLRSGELARAALADSLATGALRQGGPYLTTWLTAREAYLDARRAELDLQWQAAQARLTLQYLTGTLLDNGTSEGTGQ